MRYITIFLLALCFPVWVGAQQLADVVGVLPTFEMNNHEKDIQPPKILAPELIEEDGSVLFKWVQPSFTKDESISYEFKILQKGVKIFSTRTIDDQLKYDFNHMPFFHPNEDYEVSVGMWVTKNESTRFINGDNNMLVFRYLPECSIPRKVQIDKVGGDFINLSWGGIPASIKEVEYKIYYNSLTSQSSGTIVITTGNTAQLTGLDLEMLYEIKVTKICYLPDGTTLESEPIALTVNTEPAEKVVMACGSSYSDSGCPGTPASNPTTFTSLKMNGFDITSVSLTFTDGAYKGFGVLQLPFQSKKVRVSINAKKITTERIICEGEVEGISDLPAYWPNLYPPASVFNEICLPAGTQVGFDPNTGLWMPDSVRWNPQGFSADSQYVKQPPYNGYVAGSPVDTSGQYDPWGFDASCTNIATGTEFDPNGCSCWGTNIQGNPCQHTVEPYFWLTQDDPMGQVTQAGLTFANQQQSNIRTQVVQYLSTQLPKLQIKIDSLHDACDSIRTIMTGLIGGLQYDNNLVLGQNGMYFNEGMYLNFTQEPKPLGINMDRNPQTVSLENEHVNLYHCDAGLGEQKNRKKVIQYFQTQVGLDSLVNVLLEIIKRLPESEIQNLKKPDILTKWIKDRVSEQIEAKYISLYGNGDTGSLDTAPKVDSRFGSLRPDRSKAVHKSIQNSDNQSSKGALLASAEQTDNLALIQSFTPRPEDMAWEYAQGMEEIYGIDRAYFLEHISEERYKASLFPEFFTAHDSILQPIEIRKWAGGRYYNIYLDKIKLTRSSGANPTITSQLDAYLIMDIPTLDQKVVLKANNVNFTPNGPAVAPIQLTLNNDIKLRMNNSVRVTLKKNSTYVKVDCGGFAGIQVDGEVEVCRKYLIPLNPATLDTLPDPERVSGFFHINIDSWSAFYADITMEPFAVTGHEDYKWQVTQVAFDFSDERSPTGLPTIGYSSPFAGPSGFALAWHGIYIANLSISLPKEFTTNKQYTTFGVDRVMLDNRGFSGTAKIETQIISLGDGNAGGWGFSVDRFELTIIANQLLNGGFAGKINVPIVKGGTCDPDSPLSPLDCFNYSAKIAPGNKYQLTVTMPPNQSYCADIWKVAQISIFPNSTIDLTYANHNFNATAVLYGKLTLKPDLGNFNIKIPNEITFEGLVIKNKAPYFSGGKFSSPDSLGCEFGGFGLTVGDLSSSHDTSSPTAVALNLSLGISLTKENDGGDSLGVSATGYLKIIGEMKVVDGKQSWRYKNTRLTALNVNGTFPGASIHGEIAWYEDPSGAWGKGFRGLLQAKFTKVMQIEIAALAQFGKKSDNGGSFKYFFVDTKAIFSPGIQFFPPLELQGFGGGVYHHMSRDTNSIGALGAAPTPPPGLPPNLGVSLSGVQYVPDPNAGIGLKATVVISIPKETAFNATLSLEALFNAKKDGGGVRAIYFDGLAIVMGKLKMDNLPKFDINNKAACKAKFKIDAQFQPTFKLHGSAKTYLNVANVITGTGPAGEMTDMEVHFEPGHWYINMGTPSNPCGLRFKIGGNDLARVNAYIDIGKNIPPMPDLPQDVQSLTGMGNMMVSESVRRSGNGFAFGAKMEIGSGNRICFPNCGAFLYFYGSSHAKAGFDMMLQDYGTTACSNTGSPLGIDGWYASGQAYGLLQSGIGVGVKVFGVRKEIEILSLNAAAALQMKLPNPFWAKGAVGGRYSILNGLVKGDIQFGFTLGETCDFTENNDINTPDQVIISSIDPYSGSTGVDVMAHPTVTFNVPIGQIVPVAGLTESIELKPELAYARILYHGNILPAKLIWKEESALLELTPLSMLPANDTVKVEVKVRISKNGQEQAPEIKSVSFVTGNGYETIPDFNVKAAYPADGQYNFYPAEWVDQKGYVILNLNQPDLLIPSENEPITAKISKPDGQSFEQPVYYLLDQNRIEFALPSSKFIPEQLYKLEIIKKGAATQQGNGGNYASKGLVAVPETISAPVTVLYTAYFRTSLYNRFYDKIQALNAPPQPTIIADEDGAFKLPVNGLEPFDMFEMGNQVQISALLSATPWYQNKIYPLFYQGIENYSWTYGIDLNDRKVDSIGLPPVRALAIDLSSGSSLPNVTATDFEAGSMPSYSGTQLLYYQVPKYAYYDWNQVTSGLHEYIVKKCYGNPLCKECFDGVVDNIYRMHNPNAPPYCDGYSDEVYMDNYVTQNLPTIQLRNLFNKTGYVAPTPGAYPVEFRYTLPGIERTTTVKNLIINK